jgi:MFS family permease
MSQVEIQANSIVIAETDSSERVRRGLVLALACAAQAMVVLGIVNVALPTIQRDLDVSQRALQWVVVAYGLLLGGFVLLGGRAKGRGRLGA